MYMSTGCLGAGSNIAMRKGLWSPDEDERLSRCIAMYRNGSWSDIAQKAGLDRCGKSCRRRWMNHLRPNLKRGPFTHEEIRKVVELHVMYGNRWSEIASHMVGRTDNDVKNFWNTQVKRHVKTCMKEGKVDTAKLAAMASTCTTRSDSHKNKDNNNAITNQGIKNHPNNMPKLLFTDFVIPCVGAPSNHNLVDPLSTNVLSQDVIPPLLTSLPQTIALSPTPNDLSSSDDLTPDNQDISYSNDVMLNSECYDNWVYSFECSPSSITTINCQFSPISDNFLFDASSIVSDICWTVNPSVNNQPFTINFDNPTLT